MATLFYQGHGSLRLTTDSGKVIYIDPFAGEGYQLAADLILVTHQHYDHNRIDLPAKSLDCLIWQNSDAFKDGDYQTLTLDFVIVEAVEAYNHHHSKSKCVGYIVTADDRSIYFAEDTGETNEMSQMAKRQLDYAVLPMNFTYTMNIPETIHCAGLISAKHTIPVHRSPSELFDIKRAKQFTVPGALIVQPGESIQL